MSLNIHDIDPSYTLGDLERKRKEIIARLEKEGVIKMNRETAIPPVPQKIAVISSGTAAGFRDFTDHLNGNPHGYVFYLRLFPAIMQGDKAESSIIGALDSIHESGLDFDLVAIIRGGGSKADLDCYDSYDLAYHITQFPLPVVTGIGHEQDDTIADLVSHTRLKTPTAVADFLIGAVAEFETLLETSSRRIVMMSESLLSNSLLRLQLLDQKITSAAYMHLAAMNEKLSRRSIEIWQAVMHYFEKQKYLLDKLGRIISYADPVQVMKLGYSITKFDGRAIRDVTGLKKGDLIETKLHKGKLNSTVSGIPSPDE
jgi:exodeoxyribonuclease VII large subunit